MDQKQVSTLVGDDIKEKEDGPQAVRTYLAKDEESQKKQPTEIHSIDFIGSMSWRIWLMPALLLFFLLIPLARDGLPATHAGVSLLYPEATKHLIGDSAFNLWVVPLGYKLSVVLFVIILTAGVALIAHNLWGPPVAWWVASLWVVLPFTISLIYQVGWFFYFNALAALFFGLFFALSAENASRWYWLVALYLLFVASTGLWKWQSGLDPYQLLLPIWPPSDNLRIWMENSTYQVGLVPLVLALLTGMVAWPRRQEMAAKKVLLLLALGLISTLLTLFDGPIMLYLAIATLAFVLAAGGLPILDSRYASFPVLLAILTIAALTVYPYLQVAWIPVEEYDLPAQATQWTFGEQKFWVVDVEYQRVESENNVIIIWQIAAPADRDYTVFVHLLNEQGEIVSQADALLLDDEEVPSSQWPVGYIVKQRYQSSGLESPTQLRFGLYHSQTLERLPIDDEGGGDHVTIPFE